jgi:hypothetical protein
MRDATNAEFLDERLPNSRVAFIDAGHFVWEGAPAEYARLILDAIAEESSRPGARAHARMVAAIAVALTDCVTRPELGSTGHWSCPGSQTGNRTRGVTGASAVVARHRPPA